MKKTVSLSLSFAAVILLLAAASVRMNARAATRQFMHESSNAPDAAAPQSARQSAPAATINFQRTDFPTGTNPQSVVSADFNGDGMQDLAVANYNGGGPGSVSILLASAPGVFQPPVNYATGNGPVVVALGDFNKDGKMDLATANDTGGSVSVLIGNGDGTFKPHVDYTAGSFPHWVVAGDFNHDGKLDLAVSNEGESSVGIFLGNGDGTFRAQTTMQAPVEPYSLAAGDFNGDGRTDLAVTGYSDGIVAVYISQPGGFRPYVTYGCGEGPAAMLAADLNDDGKLDLAVADYNDGNAGFAAVLLGNGDGTFQAANFYDGAAGPDGIAVGNFNGDNKPDLVVSNLINNSMSVLYGNGDGSFQPPATFQTGSFPIGAVAGLFNGDAHNSEDIVVTNDFSNSVSVFLNEAGTLISLTSAPNPSTVGEFVNFTSHVSPTVGGQPLPTGVVEFQIGHMTAMGTLSNSVAMVNIKFLQAGNYKVQAIYLGDSMYNNNTSAPLKQVVKQ